MINTDILFLENYLEKQIYIVNQSINVKNFSYCTNVPLDEIICENTNIRKGDIVLVSNKSYTKHVVKPTETIKDIALKFNVTEEYIKELNKINKIFIGQQLLI